MLLAQFSTSLFRHHERAYSLREMPRQSDSSQTQDAAKAIKSRRRNSTSCSLNIRTSWHPAFVDLNKQVLRARCDKLSTEAVRLNYYPLAQLGTASEDFHKRYLHTLSQLDNVHDALEFYIPLDGQESGHSLTRFPLLDKVCAFLDSPQKVLLLLGETGSGKSTFQRHLYHILSAEYAKGERTDTPIVLFVPLDKYATASEGSDWIEHYLREQKFPLATIEILRTQQHFVFILEGVDEQSGAQYKHGLEQMLERWHAKYIISARPTCIQKPALLPFQANTQTSLFQTYWLAPLSDQSVQDYIQKYIERVRPSGWDLARYQKALEDAPLLKAAVRRPSLLHMALEVLPSQSTANAQDCQQHAMPTCATELYQAWITQWGARCAQRMQGIPLTLTEQAVLKKIQPYLAVKAQHASQRMAISLTQEKIQREDKENQGNTIQRRAIQGKTTSRQNTVLPTARKFYFQSDADEADKRLTLFNLPLLQQRGSPRFIYPEIQAYLVASTIYESFHRTLEVRLDSVLNQFPLMPEPAILDFLGEHAAQSPSFKVHLYDWIYQSKNNTQLSVGAANAITVLVRMGEAFTQADLQNICIAGADLRYGIFDHADLRGADLQQVQLAGAWLRHAQLEGADLQGAQFDALPFLPQPHYAKTCLYAPNGAHFAVGIAGDSRLKKGATIALYQVDTWKQIHTFTLQVPDIDARQIAFSGDSQCLVAIDAAGIVRRWDIPSGIELVPWYPVLDAQVTHLTFSPTHPNLLAVQVKNQDGWSIELWQQNKRISLYAGPVSSPAQFFCFSPNGAWLAVALAHKKRVQLWDIQKRWVIHTFPCATPCHSVAFSPDSHLLALCEYGAQLSVWKVATQTRLWMTQDGVGSARAVFSPNGQLIGTYDSQKSFPQSNTQAVIRLWHAASGELFHQQKGHTHTLSAITFAPDGMHYASSSLDKTVRLWKVPQCSPPTFKGHSQTIRGTAFSANGDLLATCADDHTICLWKMPQGQLVQSFKRDSNSRYSAQALHFSADGKWLMVQNATKKVELYRVYKEAQLALCDPLAFAHSAADTKNVENIIFSPDGKKLIKQKREILEIWDKSTHQKEHSFYLPGLHRCLFSADEQILLAVCIQGASVSVYEVESRDLVGSFPLAKRTASIVEAIYSPRGHWLATTTAQGSAIVWNARSGKQEYIFDGTTHPIQKIVFSPDDKWLATTSQDHAMRIWNAASGACVAEVNLGGATIHSLAWYIDAEQGIYLATGSDDAIVRLWQMQMHEQTQQQLSGQTASISLWWASGQTQLMADVTVLGREQGLSQLDRILLMQHGAVLKACPTPASAKSYKPYKARTCKKLPLCTMM